jgi:tetratricopeptide (TPR) repeat protein
MKRWCWLILAALVAAPAAAAPQVPQSPQSPQDAIKDAEAKAAAGDSDAAVALLKKAMASNPMAAMRLGRLRETRGELDLAVDDYKAAADKLTGPAKGEALGRMSVVEYTRGMAGAAASAQAAIAADPEGVWPTIATSYLRVHEGKADEAIALAQKAVAAGGGAPATAALAHGQEAKGDLAAAEASYRKAIADDPTAVGPVVGLATVLRKTGRAAEAEPMLQKAIDRAPGAVEAYMEMARVKIAQGRAQEALADANLAAAMGEDDAEAKALVVETKVARSLQDVAAGQVDLAVQELTQLRDEHPDSSAVRRGLGQAHIARRDADGAIAELQKAVELDPKDAEAQYQLGHVQQVMKQNPAAAVAPFEKAVQAEPGNTMFRTSLGSALLGAGQTERAVEELTKVTATEGYSGAQAWFYLGAAQLKAGRFAEAVPALEKVLAAKPDNAEAEAYLAWSYFGLKDAEGFKAHGARARQLGWKDPALFDRLAKVEAGQAIK